MPIYCAALPTLVRMLPDASGIPSIVAAHDKRHRTGPGVTDERRWLVARTKMPTRDETILSRRFRVAVSD